MRHPVTGQSVPADEVDYRACNYHTTDATNSTTSHDLDLDLSTDDSPDLFVVKRTIEVEEPEPTVNDDGTVDLEEWR